MPLALGGAVLAVAGAAIAVAHDRGAARPHPSGAQVDRRVPSLSLEDANGLTTSLASFHGKLVVFSPFLTLCHEVCPLTTGVFEAMQHSLDRAGLGRRVVFAEVSVDPWRDAPARLRAFAQLTGVRFHLFTGTPSQLARFWRFFGVAYYRTKEDAPPDRDWLTRKPLTFDVDHTDGIFVLDARGHERILDVGTPNAPHGLPHVLVRLLNRRGRRALAHPQPGYTVQQGLDDVGYLLRRRIPALGV